jgi:hypothetical protein
VRHGAFAEIEYDQLLIFHGRSEQSPGLRVYGEVIEMTFDRGRQLVAVD